jgi:SAM-dependent methyltransferase
MSVCMSLHVNYLYLLSKATLGPLEARPVVLDYGCGGGQIIEEGRKAGSQIYGTDVFYEGGNRRADIQKKGWLGNIVREIEHGVIPFDEHFFDLVVSNQVLEHVENLDAVLHEIHRVLKPGGAFLCLFPHKGVIREGHCGLPFIHWFRKQSRLRYFYALVLRRMGFGYCKGDKSASQWVSDFLQWLDRFTYYRDRDSISSSFEKYFAVSVMEHDYITFRLQHQRRRILSRFFQLGFVRTIGCYLLRRMGGLVILARKEENPKRLTVSRALRRDFEHVNTEAS